MTRPRETRQTKNATAISAKRQKRTPVSKKRFRDPSGEYARVAVLDANDDNFGRDLLRVFRENVAKARRENKRLFGSPDRVPDSN